jgi:SAM-dependent methyltransferase
MRTLATIKAFYKLFAPFDRSAGPPLHIKSHNGAIGLWYNPEHLKTLSELGLSSNDHVLDYGCGAGRMAELLFAWGVKRYTGVDCNAESLSYAKRNYGYPGYEYYDVSAQSETYGDRHAAKETVDLSNSGVTAAIALSLITHLLPGEVVSVLKTMQGCPTLTRAYISCFVAESCDEARKCGARIPLATGVWVGRKDNPSGVVAFAPTLLMKLAPGWRCEFKRGKWREKNPIECRDAGVPYQDFAVLTKGSST